MVDTQEVSKNEFFHSGQRKNANPRKRKKTLLYINECSQVLSTNTTIKKLSVAGENLWCFTKFNFHKLGPLGIMRAIGPPPLHVDR